MEHAQVYTLPSFCPFISGHTDPPASANGVSFAFCGISRTEPGHDVGPALRDYTIIIWCCPVAANCTAKARYSG